MGSIELNSNISSPAPPGAAKCMRCHEYHSDRGKHGFFKYCRSCFYTDPGGFSLSPQISKMFIEHADVNFGKRLTHSRDRSRRKNRRGLDRSVVIRNREKHNGFENIKSNSEFLRPTNNSALPNRERKYSTSSLSTRR